MYFITAETAVFSLQPSSKDGGTSSSGSIVTNPPTTVNSSPSATTPPTTNSVTGATATQGTLTSVGAVIQEVQQPPQGTPVTQLDGKCNVLDAKVTASNTSGVRPGMERSDRTPSKLKKDECTGRGQVKPVDTDAGSPANQSQRAKKPSEPTTIWQFK